MPYTFTEFRSAIELRRTDWQRDALCAPSNAGAGGHNYLTTDKAEQRRIAARCSGCPVRYDCLEYALILDEELGVWGGATESERKVLRRTVRKALRTSTRQTFLTYRSDVRRLLQPFLDQPVMTTKRRRSARAATPVAS